MYEYSLAFNSAVHIIAIQQLDYSKVFNSIKLISPDFLDLVSRVHVVVFLFASEFLIFIIDFIALGIHYRGIGS